MKELFRERKFSADREAMLDNIIKVVEKYEAMNITMTLRQLYYQLVSANIIKNNIREYKNLGVLLMQARYAGRVDWDSIEDRGRKPQLPSTFKDIPELIETAVQSYKLDWWENQEEYVELYTEKDALASVLSPLARQYRIPFNVNKGYSSSSALYDASKRFIEKAEIGGETRPCTLLYLGDHDPSGLDMVRDVRTRLAEFGADVDVFHVALTSAQVKEYNPPPNPAKFTDSRAASYISRHGRTCWEVDALPPERMIEIVRSEILLHVDEEAMEEVLEKEKKDKEALKAFAKTYKGDE